MTHSPSLDPWETRGSGKVGIDLVQGRMVDNIIRKGVSVADAIKTAKVMDDD